MGALLTLVALAALEASAPQLILRPEVVVERPEIRVGDLYRLAAIPENARAEALALVIGRLPPRANEVSLPAGAVRARLEALAPALARLVARSGVGAVRVRFAQAPVAVAADRQCLSAGRPIAAGEIVTSGDFSTAPCAVPVRRLRYDAVLRSVRAGRALQPGDAVAAPPGGALADFGPGDPLVLSARVGAVKVARELAAVRAGRFGVRTIVRGADGAPFAVLVPERGR